LPEALAGTLIILPWNDPAALERTLRTRGHEIAAVISEPLMANCGCVEPQPGFLQTLRDLTAQHDVLLILDEVITGFRLALGGAQAYYGVTPDLTTLAKAIGGGYPVAALGGRRDIMELVATNQVPYLGTYNTSTVVMAAAQATLAGLAEPGVFERLHALGDRLSSGLCELFRAQNIPCRVQGPGPVFQLWFTDRPATNYREAAAAAKPAFFARFQRAMLKRGVLFHPSQTEHFFVSTAHTDADIDQTLAVAAEAVAEIAPHFA
jgi:glutamate-1-semialdehyde 2,1-aminomutase